MRYIGLQLFCGYLLVIQKWLVYAKQLQPQKADVAPLQYLPLRIWSNSHIYWANRTPKSGSPLGNESWKWLCPTRSHGESIDPRDMRQIKGLPHTRSPHDHLTVSWQWISCKALNSFQYKIPPWQVIHLWFSGWGYEPENPFKKSLNIHLKIRIRHR